MPADPSFKMTIMDVFAIRGRGTVVTGLIESGKIHVDDKVEIHSSERTSTTTVTTIEMFRKSLDSAVMGDQVGLYLQDIDKNDVKRGDVLTGVVE